MVPNGFVLYFDALDPNNEAQTLDATQRDGGAERLVSETFPMPIAALQKVHSLLRDMACFWSLVPSRLGFLARQEHGWTIPLATLGRRGVTHDATAQ
jgi:hypothetical protein